MPGLRHIEFAAPASIGAPNRAPRQFPRPELEVASFNRPQPRVVRFYRPELDVVRFLAFLLVFLCHNLPRTPTARMDSLLGGSVPVFLAFANGSTFGLSLFFTLSAFLICELLLREREARGTVGVKQFYIRRILRIWPLYYLGLALGAIYAVTPLGDPHALVEMTWFVVFLGAWQSAVRGWLSNPMFVLWSVSVEEQFYLFAPWMIRWSTRKVLYGLCAALIFASNLRLYYLWAHHISSDRIWADSLVQFQCFACGILLCLVLHGKTPRIAGWQRLSLFACSGLCWLWAGYGLEHLPFGVASDTSSWPLMTDYALATVGSVLVITASLGVNPKLLPKWVVYLGRISYGLYVFHELAHGLAFALLSRVTSHVHVELLLSTTLGLTVLMAALSYRYFETPFLKLKKRHAIIESRPV